MLARIAGGLVAASVLVACSGGAGNESTGASSAAVSASTPVAYLALGDSIAFGDNGFIPYDSPQRTSGDRFTGYPEVLAVTDAKRVENLGCPGETTGSFLSATAPDNGCRQYKATFPRGLHDNYPGETQIQAALASLATDPPKLVTLNIGANDLLLAEYACATTPDPMTCAMQALPGAVTTAAQNVAQILGAIRQVGGYTGTIVLLTQYSTNYNDPLQGQALPALNGAFAQVAGYFGAKVADGYKAFADASQGTGGDPCKAGLLIPNPSRDGTCDKHPSLRGQTVLAKTIDAVEN